MIPNLLAALLISLVIGSSLTYLLAPMRGGRFIGVLLVLSLGIGSGLGLSSLLLFLWLLVASGNGKLEPIGFVVLGVALAAAAAIQGCGHGRQHCRLLRRVTWLLGACSLAAGTAIATFAFLSLHSPHGGWDAWSDWNRHARFMFLGGEHWRDVFSAAEAGWTPGYPMLLPGAIATCWFFVGKESLLAPSAVAFCFTMAVAGLLVASLSLLRSISQGLIAGIVLLCSPQFIAQGVSQYADVPLSYFYLSAILLLCLHDSIRNQPGWLVMSGMMTGMAAWTKPEGLLFTLVVVLARFLVIARLRGARTWTRELLSFTLGLLPVLAIVLYFKFGLVGAVSDLVTGQTPRVIVERLLTTGRYMVIVKALAKQVISFGGWIIMLPPVLLMYLFVAGINEAQKDRSSIYTGLLTLMLMTCGYVIVYASTPHDLNCNSNFPSIAY